MARKKVIFFIVEGPSDEQALGVVLSRIFADSTVLFDIVHGDITTQEFASDENIRIAVTNRVKEYAATNKLRVSDFLHVYHIMDTDGAFVPENAVVEDPAATDPIYSETCIKTKNRDGILKRNATKRYNMARLARTPTIWGTIPYEALYMSCCLDHVLYNKLNSTDEEKDDDSYQFAQQYKNRIDDFRRLVLASDFSVCTNHLDSWSFIQQNLHSLERHSNLGLCFPPTD